MFIRALSQADREKEEGNTPGRHQTNIEIVLKIGSNLYIRSVGSWDLVWTHEVNYIARGPRAVFTAVL